MLDNEAEEVFDHFACLDRLSTTSGAMTVLKAAMAPPEPILYGWKPTGSHRWYADRKQTTVWNFDRPQKNAEHPTMKPVGLYAYPIRNSSLSNCIVLDPFGGSGSTLIASEQLNRICHTMELDGKYCDVIVRRYIEYKGSDQDVLLLRQGEKMLYAEVS